MNCVGTPLVQVWVLCSVIVHVSVTASLVASPTIVPMPVHSREPTGNSNDMNPSSVAGRANALIAPTHRDSDGETVFHEPSTQSAC